MSELWFESLELNLLIALKRASGSDLWDKDVALAKIKGLDLYGLGLRTFPEIFKDMKNMKYLNLANNELQVFMDEYKFSKALEELVLSDNKIVSFSFEGCPENPALTMLNLDNNSIFDMPSELNKATNLKELRLCDNNVSDLGDLKLPDGISSVYLSDNAISEITKAQAKELSKAQELYLSNNNLRKIPRELFQGKLKVLRVVGNDIEDWGFLSIAAKNGVEVES